MWNGLATEITQLTSLSQLKKKHTSYYYCLHIYKGIPWCHALKRIATVTLVTDLLHDFFWINCIYYLFI